MKRLVAAGALLLASLPLVRAEEKKTAAAPPPPGVPVERRGLAIGRQAPAFLAKDQYGHRQDLASLMGPQGLVLLFVRSADW